MLEINRRGLQKFPGHRKPKKVALNRINSIMHVFSDEVYDSFLERDFLQQRGTSGKVELRDNEKEELDENT